MCVANDCFWGFYNDATPTHTTECSSTKSVLLNPNRRHPNPPNDIFSKELGAAMCAPMIVVFWFCNGAIPTHTRVQ
jgi:hypothetical protein